ncbi:MAG: VCBS repeat-containing protein [Verrucomicrobia bacterium]|nr:VCBS repeat-containing protein [Verrucomicrobiota bacterium]
MKSFFSLLLATSVGWITAARAGTTTNDFGFAGREIYPIESQISLLHAADLDGDGLTDLVVANNVRSKITLLYNQTGKTNRVEVKPARKRELNELPPDARLRIESIASEKRIAAMVVTDLNGDGRPDIAYYGDPKELIVIYNQDPNTWSAPKRWPIEDGQLTGNALAAGDLNGDGRTDLVLLAENHVCFLAQKEDHTLAEPEKIPFLSPVKSAQVLDVDGDGRSDLLLVNWESPTPFRFRLQNAAGQLGPENYFTLPPIRSYCAANFETNGQTFVVTIALNSGRAQISQFARKPAETLAGAFRQGQFQVLPLNKTDKARRGLLWADVNGDGRTDLLVAEPERGQISVYLQKLDGSLAGAKSFPTLAGVSDLGAADWDGDGKPEIFLLSPNERQVGVTRFDEKERLPFPTLIPFDGRPLVLAVGALQPGEKPTLAVLVEKDDRRSLVMRTADGKGKTQKLSADFKSNPTLLAIHDVNQDGLADLVALVPYEKVKILLQVAGLRRENAASSPQAGRDFDELDVAPPGGVIEAPWLSAADVDGDGKAELLLTQKNFLRAVVVKKEALTQNSTGKPTWTFQVKDQINGAASNSRLAGAAAVRNGTNAVASLFLLDAERKALTLCERDVAGVWQVVRNVVLPVSEFGSLQPVALGGTNINSVAFLGLNAVAWMPLAGDTWEFTALDGYETSIKDGYLNDVVSGDLNHDGRKDLVFMETAKNYLDLVIFDAKHKLVPADRWQVFEQRTFRGRGGDMPEPREAVVVDLTGDGKNDLAVIVHDRILVYPQE